MTAEGDWALLPANVAQYQQAVSDLVSRWDPISEDPEILRRALSEAIESPEMRPVLEAAGVDPEHLTARASAAAEGFRARAAATATSAQHEVEIMLRQQVDLAWWAHAQDFDSDADLVSSPEMVDLRSLRRGGQLQFRFALASDQILPRAWKYAIRRWRPDYAPGTPGLSSPYARPQMVTLLNRIATDFAQRTALVRPDAPPLWVNSITRTVAHQCQLLELGFSAHYPSAHCKGWAADIEVGWYARFGMDAVLIDVLSRWQHQGRISAIDEGRIWHVCPHPSYAEEL